MNKPIWKPVVGYEGFYEVSNMGDVRVLERTINTIRRGKVTPRTFKARSLTGTVTGNGYRFVLLCNNGIKKKHSIHRLVGKAFLGIKDCEMLDHINRNPLDNRLENIRVCTLSQNGANRRPNKGKKYKGVRFMKNEKRWTARIVKDGKHRWLGYFDSEVEAAKGYDKAAIELFGEFAKLNINPV